MTEIVLRPGDEVLFRVDGVIAVRACEDGTFALRVPGESPDAAALRDINARVAESQHTVEQRVPSDGGAE